MAALLAAEAAAGVEPDPLPGPMWWRAGPARSLARDPRALLAPGPDLRLAGEWAPLYSASDGARLESDGQVLSLAVPWGAWRSGFELATHRGFVSGSGAGAWLGVDTPARGTSTLALARNAGRFAAAASATVADDRPGAAVSLAVQLAPRLAAELVWSRLSERGSVDVGWEDGTVRANGSWTSQRLAVTVEAAPGPGTTAWLGLESLERQPFVADGPPGDDLGQALSWRALSLGGTALAGPGRWRAELQAGQGRQDVELLRFSTPYARLSGPIEQSLGSLELQAARWPIQARVWVGRWSGQARGSLALWPFDVAGAVLGTRRVAHSDVALGHIGVALDARPAGRFVDGGLALSRLAPRASYESWQATLAGLGHDDPASGAAEVRAAWLAGLRLAVARTWGGLGARLEGVQWLPVRVERDPEDGTPAGGGGPAGVGSGKRAVERGGTVVRLELTASR